MSPDKFAAALQEAGLHAQVLSEALTQVQDERPFGAPSVRAMAGLVRQRLDQTAYRFMKLQDTLGERVLPGLLELADEPLADSATFQQKLNRLERLEVIDSAADWRRLRTLRDQIAHEYPDAPEIQAALIELLLEGAAELLTMWRKIERAVERIRG